MTQDAESDIFIGIQTYPGHYHKFSLKNIRRNKDRRGLNNYRLPSVALGLSLEHVLSAPLIVFGFPLDEGRTIAS